MSEAASPPSFFEGRMGALGLHSTFLHPCRLTRRSLFQEVPSGPFWPNRLSDQGVFWLYGLTDEEVALVVA